MQRDDDLSPFHFSVLPIDPENPFNPRPPSPEIEQEALTDILCQLVTHLTAAAKVSRSDPFRAIRVLANCERICAEYTGFILLADFQRELKTNLRSALRKARRAFLREAFLCRKDEFPAYLQTMRDTGWRSSHAEAQADFDQVVHELFQPDGHWRPAARAERARRYVAPE
jgi:hypothetical protein